MIIHSYNTKYSRNPQSVAIFFAKNAEKNLKIWYKFGLPWSCGPPCIFWVISKSVYCTPVQLFYLPSCITIYLLTFSWARPLNIVFFENYWKYLASWNFQVTPSPFEWFKNTFLLHFRICLRITWLKSPSLTCLSDGAILRQNKQNSKICAKLCESYCPAPRKRYIR